MSAATKQQIREGYTSKMSRLKSRFRVALSTLILVAVSHQTNFASLLSSTVPPDFSLVISESGTALYQKHYPNGSSDFVQVINLGQGAAIKLLHGKVADAGMGQGVYGGNNPAFWRQTLREAWNEFALSNSNAFCITNSQFFSAHEDPTQFAFPLKKDGDIISDGYSLNAYPGQKLMLEIWRDGANIAPLSKEALYSSSAPDILAGLSEYAAGRRPNIATGRTFVGVDDRNPDGKHEILLIFTSKRARKTEAAAVLRRFGADKVMMLDGGGSTQLICKGTSYIRAARTIPQTIAVLSMVVPPFASAVVR